MFRTLPEEREKYLTDLRGTTVYGINEEKLGKVDDVIIDDRSGDPRYLIVDAGLPHFRRFILPVDQVQDSAEGNELFANLTQRDAQTLPQFRDELLQSDDAFTRYENDYRNAWHYDADLGGLRPSSRLERLRDELRGVFTRNRVSGVEPETKEDREIRKFPAATYSPIGAPRPATVYGVFSDDDKVEKTLTKLKDLGFAGSDISVVFPERAHTREFAIQHSTKSPEGALAGGGTGLVIGGVLGWLAGIGTLAMPGLGPLIAAGPIVAAVTGAGVGSAVGGIAGALIGLGVPELEAKRYEEEIRRGRTLISVHCEGMPAARQAREVLEKFGAREVFLSGELRAA
jgi:sporulation protein YlmC with PRC-barrel domain